MLAPGVWVGTLGGRTMQTSYGANAVAIAGTDATLVVDPLIAPSQARFVEEALHARGFPPIRHVLLTHHHTDHTLGAAHFLGARIHATPACAERMRREHPAIIAGRLDVFPDARPVVPTDVFTDTTVDLGGLTVRLLQVGPAHTDGDAIAYTEQVVVCGDLIFNGYSYNYEDATPARLEETLAALPASALYIPGHGAAGGRDIVDAQIAVHRARTL